MRSNVRARLSRTDGYPSWLLLHSAGEILVLCIQDEDAISGAGWWGMMHDNDNKPRNIAAIYVETNGAYFNQAGIDPWDEARDARLYRGPYPVIAHPPCQRWGKLWAGQPLFIKQTGVRKVKGDDGGCFAAALAAVRRWGGVLEHPWQSHPWQSHAWPHYGLNMPSRKGGWITADFHGGWTCCVEQGKYGHYARKPTLLYAFGVTLPELEWGHSEMQLDPAVVERMGLKRAKRLGEVGARGGGKNSTPRIHTPAPFHDLLISMARSVSPPANDNKQAETDVA